MTATGFLFILCQVGAEKALKEELAQAGFQLAFSRPGFVTFRASAPLEGSHELASVFARAYGLTLGKASDPVGLSALARPLQREGRRLRLHVVERDRFAPGSEPMGFVPGAWARAAREALLPGTESLFEAEAEARPGDRVLDVIAVEEGEWWVGWHEHTPFHSPFPGGNPGLELPAEAPSRAFLKLEEAILWSGARLREGQRAIEIGSAPGGAAYALLARGLEVIGIDPGEMAPGVLAHPRFRHIRSLAGRSPARELPDSAQWVLLDVNTHPEIALHEAEVIVRHYPDSLLGVLFTLKLNEWKMAAEIPSWRGKVRAMGMTRVRATQLPHNRQEITVFGLTPRGALSR
jgi:23S rRNA (cytidine2498-2'-O)-methyltransferase